jgi:hypothetical protein
MVVLSARLQHNFTPLYAENPHRFAFVLERNDVSHGKNAPFLLDEKSICR